MRRMGLVWVVAGALLLALLAGPAPADKVSAEKMALARKMVALAAPTLKATLDRLNAVVKKRCTKPDTTRRLRVVFDDYIKGLTVEIARHLSLKNLKAFMAFYQTPVGRKLVASQVVILNQFVKAMVRLQQQRAKGDDKASLADAIALKNLDPKRLAASRALAVKAKFGQMMAGGTAGSQLAKQGITPAMMQEFWARLMAQVFTVPEIKQVEVFYSTEHYAQYVKATPKFRAAAKKLAGPLQQRIVQIFQTCK